MLTLFLIRAIIEWPVLLVPVLLVPAAIVISVWFYDAWKSVNREIKYLKMRRFYK
jgi:hypothetical protein